MSTLIDFVQALRIEFPAPSPALARYIEAQTAANVTTNDISYEEWGRLRGAAFGAFQALAQPERDQCWRVANSVGIFRDQNRLG